MNRPKIKYMDRPVLEPLKGCPWADTMVLNPAIVSEEGEETIHMLFRATGPWPVKNLKGLSDPYPIFLGYAKSEDNGETWEADFECPALSPALEYEMDRIYIINDRGEKVINYSNGCIEDPRIFFVEGECYLTAACRMFPPGPYWEGDKRRDNLPGWAMEPDNPLGTAAYRNDTTTVLYRLDLPALKERRYEEAFHYICPLTDGNKTDNRDVYLFPEKMKIDGIMQYVMVHRPDNPSIFLDDKTVTSPSICMAAAPRLEDFATDRAVHKLLASGIFDWEEERTGASFPPIKIQEGEWLVSYHGKQLPDYGYTQSFMILKEQEDDFPEIIHRCPERLMYAKQDWELPDKFSCPCLFTTGGILKDDELIMSYGAADQMIGIAWACFDEIVDYIRMFDKQGKRTSCSQE